MPRPCHHQAALQSAFGRERTSTDVMSAFGQKRHLQCKAHVRFTPEATSNATDGMFAKGQERTFAKPAAQKINILT